MEKNMEALSFIAPLNIKKLFFNDTEQLNSKQYLVLLNTDIDNKYNVYLTTDSPTIDDSSLELDADNLILINYYDSISKDISLKDLLTFLEKSINKKPETLKKSEIIELEEKREKREQEEKKEKSDEEEKEEEKKREETEKKLNTSIIELGSSIDSNESRQTSSLDSDSSFDIYKCDVDLSEIVDNWINSKFNDEYKIYDIPKDGNCFFYSVILAYKYNLPEEDRKNIEYIPEKVFNVLKTLIETQDILPDDVLLKLKEISDKLPENMCSKYNYGILALRYILSLQVSDDYFVTYKLRFSEEERETLGLDSIETIDDFKRYILTDNYWADEWAMAKLQELLDIQFVIFDQEKKRIDGCNLSGEIFSKSSDPTKIKSIFINWQGESHYELISYKNKTLIDFNDLPKIVKDKCLPSKSGGNKITKKKYTKNKKGKERKKKSKKANKANKANKV
jgi:hypothetical protein